MKSRSDIWRSAAENLGAQCSVDTRRDSSRVSSRCAREGDTFLKVALPAFLRDFERCLREERVPSTAFVGFKRRPVTISVIPDGEGPVHRLSVDGRGVPQFLGGFLGLVFRDEIVLTQSEFASLKKEALNNGMSVQSIACVRIRTPEMGSEEEERIANAIWAVRQLCGMFGKEKELCSDSLIERAVQDYVATDEDIASPLKDRRADILFEGGRLDDVKRVLMTLFGKSLYKIDRQVYRQELLPGHGPGSTADRLFGNQKWTLPEWTDRLQEVFPYLEYALPNHRYWKAGEPGQVKYLSPAQERPVKLTAVAKTHTTPRLIAIEPTCMQYMQQALARPLVAAIEDDSSSSPFVGFTDQGPNQAMAQFGSDERTLATLDLSEASDRVGNWIVEELFADTPHFLEGMQACRSTRVKLPSGEIRTLLKFASMGSALTFPIEAMVFTSIVLEACLRADGRTIAPAAIKRYRNVVRVYGDDIIVPVEHAETVVQALETFGLKVNRNKSFWTGGFRESCGKEYWNGYDVSIVRIRKPLPTTRRDVDGIVSTVASRNLFFKAGLEDVAAELDEVIMPILRHYPYVSDTSPILGRVHRSGLYQIDTMDNDTHGPRVKGYVVKSKIPFNEIDDHNALMKVFLESIGKRNADHEHLTRSGRPRAVSMKLVQASPY